MSFVLENASPRAAAAPQSLRWVIRSATQRGAPAIGIRLAGAGIALALQFVLARALGANAFGTYSYVLAWIQVATLCAQSGFSTAALRYLASYRAGGQSALARGFLVRCSQFVLVSSFIVATIMVGIAATVTRPDSVAGVQCYLIAASILLVLPHVVVRSAVIRGLGYVIAGMSCDLAYPALFLGTILVVHGLGAPLSSNGALLLNLFSAACAIGIVVALQKDAERELRTESKLEFRTGEWLSTSLLFMVASCLVHLQGRTGVILTGWLLDARAAGIYAAVERLTDTTLIGLASINLLAAPRFAALHTQRRIGALQSDARLAAWGATGFMLATVVPLVLFGKPILGLFGPDFVVGYPALLVLLVGVAVNATCGSVGLILNMTGHHRDVITVALGTLCANVGLSVVLIPPYGILGTALAAAVSMVLWNVAMLIIARWRLGIWVCIGPIERH